MGSDTGGSGDTRRAANTAGTVHLLGVSEDGATLRLADGAHEYSLPIDERLRAAVNGHLSRLGQLTMALESHISPREIQARVRTGESAEQVAQSAGVPVERVLRFIGPVLREREHAADMARAARVERDTAGPAPLLGDIVDHAMQRRGLAADDATWDAAKSADGSWTVTISWPSGPHHSPGGSTQWRFDVARRQAAALDAGARELSGQREPEPDADADADADAGPIAPVTPFVPRLAPATTELKPSAIATGWAVPHEAEPHEAEEADAEEADAEEADGSEELAASMSTDESTAPEAADEPAPTRRGRSGRRAQVPKWDDIVFGIKPPDSPSGK